MSEYKTVTTRDELIALPMASVIRTRFQEADEGFITEVLERWGSGNWYATGDEFHTHPDEISLPAQVLYRAEKST